MQYLDDLLHDSVQRRQVPYIVASVGRSAGTVWTGQAGNAAGDIEASDQTLFRIFSMTKAIAATGAAILAERKQLDWNWPVAAVLPQSNSLEVLDGMRGNVAFFRRPRSGTTLLQLATHQSGLAYEYYDPVLAHYFDRSGKPTIISGLKKGLLYPFRFDPGTRWRYGTGIDWLGLVIETIDGRPIDRFCREEIFEPLQMTHTVFEPGRADVVGDIFLRRPDGGLTAAPVDVAAPRPPEFYAMGHALYSTPADYMRFLRMWLNHGELDGRRLISTDTATSFLADQLGELTLPELSSCVPRSSHDFVFFPRARKGHSLGFARMQEGVAGMRSEGSQFWGGLLNTHFWFDTRRDIAVVVMTQLLPFLDPPFMAAMAGLEKSIYHNFA
ncbi:serine hydrolase domain-containing protein [Rhizobium mayense]|uniref:Serine hydrolase domain-containing protein n=1 Tax=Rhizobium mayense TaxID=1312184 RepID=A0ABT7K5S1_9HYPH|nr:serine hydrolase domain-containing protein [Rhizobium mayense]MDL2403963.1 serine hydrolase domain-containing protein [Rhizobium mayense]